MTTTLALAEMARRGDAVYLDLELPSAQRQLDDPEAFLLAQRHQLIILDGVQRLPELFAVLRNSNSPLFRRVRFYRQTPLPSDLNSLWVRGGFPLSWLPLRRKRRLASTEPRTAPRPTWCWACAMAKPG